MARSPAPWKADHDGRPHMEWNIHIFDADGDRVCFLAHNNLPGNKLGRANATLIENAPELLDAAREVEQTLRKLIDSGLVDIACDGEITALAVADRLSRLHAVIKEIDTLSPGEAG